MRNSRHRLLHVVIFLLCTLVAVAPAQSQSQTNPKDKDEVPDTKNENPEYRRRSLPADTFKPSEEVSEDFAVPFPVDI